MGTLTKPYTFTAQSYAVAAQVNANFDTLFGWINGGSGIWADGSVPFTTVPSGPSVDPTAPNHLTRKSYVDTAAARWWNKTGTVATEMYTQGGSGVTTTDANGKYTVIFTPPFPNGIITALVCLGDQENLPHEFTTNVTSAGINNTGINGIVFYNGAPLANSNVRINWIAFGY